MSDTHDHAILPIPKTLRPVVERLGTEHAVDTVFDDNASTHVALGRGPYTGSYQPDSSLSNLAGKNVGGVWKLWIEDRVGSSQGLLKSWEVIVN